MKSEMKFQEVKVLNKCMENMHGGTLEELWFMLEWSLVRDVSNETLKDSKSRGRIL